MPVNIWSAGQDALLDFLATRDANRRLAEDRARRDRLDAEMAADRERQRSIQEENLRLMREDREERRAEMKRVNDERIRASEEKRQQDERVQTLVKEMLDPATPAERKQAIGFELDRLQVSPTLIDKYLNPKPTTKPVFGIDPRSGTVRQFGEVPTDAQVVTVPKPEGSEKPAYTPQQLLVLQQQARRQAMAELKGELISESDLENRVREIENEGRAILGAPLIPEPEPLVKDAQGNFILPSTGVRGPSIPDPPRRVAPAQPDEALQQPQATHESLMASVPNGKRVKFSDGSVWEKGHDGSVRRVQ